MHATDGTLRRLLDEPQAILGSVRRHVDGCVPCRRRLAALADDARAAAAAFARADAAPGRFRPGAVRAGVPRRPAAAAVWTAAAAAAVAAFAFAPVRSSALGFLSIFEPQRVVGVAVTTDDLRALRAMPDLSQFGSSREVVRARTFSAGSDSRRAAAAARFPVRVPVALPRGVHASSSYVVFSREVDTFTFEAAKVRANTLRRGAAVPAMPPGLDGSTLTVSLGPTVVAMYGAPPNAVFTWGGFAGHRASHQAVPNLVMVAQSVAPRVDSSGASAVELERYLLSLPGLSPHLAAQIAAIGDPTRTLPIPVPVDRAFATPVAVDGATGLGIGDETGVGAAVVWQRAGMLYAVAGPLPAHDILAVANALR